MTSSSSAPPGTNDQLSPIPASSTHRHGLSLGALLDTSSHHVISCVHSQSIFGFRGGTMKRSLFSGVAASAAALALVLGGAAAPASAALGETGSTYCSGSTPSPWLKVRAVGFFLATPPNGTSTFYGFSYYSNWYGAGRAPGGGWSAWVQNGGGFTPDIDTSQTYGYCNPV